MTNPSEKTIPKLFINFARTVLRKEQSGVQCRFRCCPLFRFREAVRFGEKMKNTFPDYYKRFSCIADACPDTCCAGWGIVADKESLDKYEKIGGDFGKKIKSCLAVDDDGDTVFTPINNRCPFLLENGLCEMYIKLGHDNLCLTCRRYPRHITYFGSRCETGLSLSCPEAARIIMSSSTPIAFECESNNEPPVPTDIDAELYFTLIEARKKAIDILQNRKFSIEARLCAFLLFSQEISPFIRSCDCRSIDKALVDDYFEYDLPSRSQRSVNGLRKKLFADFRQLETLDDSIKELSFAAEKANTAAYAAKNRQNEWEYEHLLVYFVFRYFMTAVFDGDLLVKSKFTAAAFIIIKKLQAAENADKRRRVQIIRRFSKEVEHSDFNMKFLIGEMKRSRCYDIKNLINLITENQL